MTSQCVFLLADVRKCIRPNKNCCTSHCSG